MIQVSAAAPCEAQVPQVIAEHDLVRRAAAQAPAPRFAVLALGFRPFFLLAGLHAALAIPLWLVVLEGGYDPASAFGSTYWHAHEMLFGFAVAVIAGFLLTAASNWTGRTTAKGAWLGALAAVWIAGRAAMLGGAVLSPGVVAAVDLAFLPLLAFAVGRAIVAARDRRNYAIVAILALLFVANALMHAGWFRRGALMAMDVVLVLMVVIGARVIPSFTKNATRAGGIRNLPAFDRAAALGMLAIAVADATGAPLWAIGALSGLTALLLALGVRHWGARHTARVPLLWVLHVAHAWIIVGLALRFLSWLTPLVPETAAVHAFTAGAVATLTLGMMARVARGHTGRMIVAARTTTAAFVLVTLAALVRVTAPLALTGFYLPTLLVAGTLFAAAFALFLIDCAPMLVRPRVDGKPG